MGKLTQNTKKMLAFWEETEKLKLIERIPVLSDGIRRENDAEHSWHLALMLMTVRRELDIKFNLGHALELAIIHDLSEIDTGDAWVEMPEAKRKKHQAEKVAADRIFGILPHVTGKQLKDLWLEYEEGKTPEAKIVKALDKICYSLQYGISNKIVWEGEACSDKRRKDYALPYVGHDETLAAILEYYSELIDRNQKGQK